MFRFLLEARENLALFTVLDRKLALLKLLFAPESEKSVRKALAEMGKSIKLEILALPPAISHCYD